MEQFEKLHPTVDELNRIFSSYGADDVNDAVKRLVEEKYVVYLKRSNNYLRLKETSGVDLRTQISDMIAKRANKLDVKGVLNDSNFDHYLYPSRYNDDKEMTRYFDFRFIDAEEVSVDTDWSVKRENIKADGVAFAIIPNSAEDIQQLKTILASTNGCEDCIFVVPNKYQDIHQLISEFDAVQLLMQTTGDDTVLFEDYEVVYEDLRDVLRTFIETYTRPEKRGATYYYAGEQKMISRKSDLTNLLSGICDALYGLTPVINNEVINKEEPTSIAVNSRNKLIAGLLRTELEPNLGLTGSGQDVSIMRSTVVNTGIVVVQDGFVKINLKPKDELLAGTISVIEEFLSEAGKENGICFSVLYENLTSSRRHIGMRKGLIPIYLSAVLHEYKKKIVIKDRFGQVTLNADIIEQINAEPGMFTVSYIDWNPEKESYLAKLSEIFADYLIEDGATAPYERVMIAMKRWYMALPKYAKNAKHILGKKIQKEDRSFLQEMRKNAGSYELLFNIIPKIYKTDSIDSALAEKVGITKRFFDGALDNLKSEIKQFLRIGFCTLDAASCEKMSLSSIIRDWCEKIDRAAFDQLFTDGTERCLALFKEITNDEDLFVTKIARVATDLRLEDWDEDIITMFMKNMEQYRSTAESFHLSESDVEENVSKIIEDYELSFKDDSGKVITKRFSKVEESRRGKLLFNAIVSQLDSMGQAISEQEKRQILMEVLKELC